MTIMNLRSWLNIFIVKLTTKVLIPSKLIGCLYVALKFIKYVNLDII